MEPFDIDGLTPKEVLEKIQVTYLEVVASAFAKGYEHGYKDGMTEAVTTITE